MSNPTAPQAAAAQDNAAVFAIQRMYLKDLSLEQPNSPAIFLEQDAPQVNIELDVASNKLHDDIFEVSVTATITTKVKEQIAFLVEAKQACIFQIANVPADQLQPILGIACPNIIYPYLRANVADVIQRAGFPPIHLSEINFEAYYNERMAEAAKK